MTRTNARTRRLPVLPIRDRTTALGSGLALLLAALPLAASAAGATQFNYSPLTCQTFGGALWIYPTGQIANRSTTEPMKVLCPLIHEQKHEHSGKIQVSVVQANQNKKGPDGKVLRVECRAVFNHPHANPDPPPAQNDWEGKSDLANGAVTATITLPGAKTLGGSHMLECRVPPRDPAVTRFDGESRIGTYRSGVD